MLLTTYSFTLITSSLENFISPLDRPWAGSKIRFYQLGTICSYKMSVQPCLSLYCLKGAKIYIEALN